MTLLLTGFEPFGKFDSNPSWDALEYAFHESLLPEDAALARIPVEYASAFSVLEAAVEEHSPTAIVNFGLHSGMAGRERQTIYIETVARNRDDVSKPDNAKVMRKGSVIINNAPETLNATFPARQLLESLHRGGFDAELSENAGAYLCNHLFYRVVHAYGGRFPCGFVHVPPVEESGGTMQLNQLARAIGIIAGAIRSI